MKIFSFTLFGSSDKYCKGLFVNINQIEKYFPEWKIWIYIGNDVEEKIIDKLNNILSVNIILTNKVGMINKFYRFFPIDNDKVDICIIRDTDSRIYDRDISCINDFIKSDKLFHIIRDHPNHYHKILAGMWGIKKGSLKDIKIESLYNEFIKNNSFNTFWDDGLFLCNILYPLVKDSLIVHDEIQNFEQYNKINFKVPLDDDKLNFVGQVYEYNINGFECAKFEYKKSNNPVRIVFS